VWHRILLHFFFGGSSRQLFDNRLDPSPGPPFQPVGGNLVLEGQCFDDIVGSLAQTYQPLKTFRDCHEPLVQIPNRIVWLQAMELEEVVIDAVLEMSGEVPEEACIITSWCMERPEAQS